VVSVANTKNVIFIEQLKERFYEMTNQRMFKSVVISPFSLQNIYMYMFKTHSKQTSFQTKTDSWTLLSHQLDTI